MFFTKFKKLLHSFKYIPLKYFDLHFKIFDACKEGDLNTVEYLLTTKFLLFQTDINWRDDFFVTTASSNKHYDIVKFLLTSKKLKNHANIHAQDDVLLINACSNNNVDMVNFLLTSPDLKEHIDIHTKGGNGDYYYYDANTPDIAFQAAYYNNSLDVIKYLLFSQKLKDKIDLTLHTEKIFEQIYNGNFSEDKKIETLNFLILEADLEKTPKISHFLVSSKPNKKNNYSKFGLQVSSIFEKQRLYQSLKNTLNNNIKNSTRIRKI